ncbi:MAG: hypothetical protein KDK40_03290 [Chlamydiia bacterium]|nr:hypothetical protein [Chlamydiia bacterium]
MWWKEYKNRPVDSRKVRKRASGMAGCEMHERVGWGVHSNHSPESVELHNLKRSFKRVDLTLDKKEMTHDPL